MRVRVWAAAVLLAAGCGGGSAEPAPDLPPTIPSDFLAYLPVDVPGTAPVRGELHGPHFGYALTAAGTTRSAPAGLGLDTGAVPAAGHDLFLAELGPTTAPPYEDRPPTVALVVGDEIRPLPADSLTGTIAVVVPTGASPLLQVTDSGRRQTLDLRTGARSGDVVDGYYPPVGGTWQPAGPTVSTFRLGGAATAALSVQDRVVRIGLAGVTGGLEPWTPERGWAAAGRAWLVLRPRITYERRNAVPGQQDTVAVSPSAVQATGPGGRLQLSDGVIRLAAANAGDTVTAEGTGTLSVEVPATQRGRIAIRFAYVGTVVLPSGPTTLTQLTAPTLTGTVTLA